MTNAFLWTESLKTNTRGRSFLGCRDANLEQNSSFSSVELCRDLQDTHSFSTKIMQQNSQHLPARKISVAERRAEKKLCESTLAACIIIMQISELKHSSQACTFFQSCRVSYLKHAFGIKSIVWHTNALTNITLLPRATCSGPEHGVFVRRYALLIAWIRNLTIKLFRKWGKILICHSFRWCHVESTEQSVQIVQSTPKVRHAPAPLGRRYGCPLLMHDL